MSSLPEGSSDILGGGDHGEDGNGVVAEWGSVRKGLERTATVDVVLSNESAHTNPGGKVSVGGVETGMGDGIESGEMDGGLNGSNGSNLEDMEDSGASQKVMEYLHDAREDIELGSTEAMFRGYQKIHHEGKKAEEIPKVDTSVSSPTLSTSKADDTQSVHVGYQSLHFYCYSDVDKEIGRAQLYRLLGVARMVASYPHLFTALHHRCAHSTAGFNLDYSLKHRPHFSLPSLLQALEALQHLANRMNSMEVLMRMALHGTSSGGQS